MAAAEPIRSKAQVMEMANFYFRRGNLRNYLLIILGVHTALRISDLLSLRFSDVYDFNAACFRTHIAIVERKTKKRRTIALGKQSVEALRLCYPNLPACSPDAFLFRSNRTSGKAISRVQAYRIIRAAADAIGVRGVITCHSLRKTFGYHAWQSGAPVAVIMDIYNHSSYDITRRYLGISQDDRDKVYLAMALI